MKIVKLSLIMLIGGAFLYYFYVFDPTEESSKFLGCPSKTLFGLNCPGCGSQRLIHHLLHFRLEEAFRFNPLLFLFFPVVIYLAVIFIANTFFGTKYRIALFYKNWFVFSILILFILYGILRNLPWYPFTLLAPPIG